MKTPLLTAFALGALIGGIAMAGFTHSRHRDPVLSCSGRVQLDTASYDDSRLSNAIFIDHPDAPQGRMYLKFNDDRTMNEAIGKSVTATGALHSVKLDNGGSITELHVGELKYRPDSSQ